MVIMAVIIINRDRIFVKRYGFLLFAKNMGKNISKNLSSKYSQNLLDHAKHTDALQKGRFKKQEKQLVVKLKNSKKSKKIKILKKSHQSIIQKQMKKKKDLEKEINLKNKDRKLLMI